MKRKTYAVVVVVAAAAAMFILAPLVYSPIKEENTDPSFATWISAYESPSCYVLGWGMTYEGPSPVQGVVFSSPVYNPQTYHLGCLPSSINTTTILRSES